MRRDNEFDYILNDVMCGCECVSEMTIICPAGGAARGSGEGAMSAAEGGEPRGHHSHQIQQ